MPEPRFMTSAEASAELKVNRATLYSYVSRGLIRSEPSKNGRQRLYRADDVKVLRGRKAPRSEREDTLKNALNFGAPVLSSAITLIEDNRLFYRGRDAVDLAKAATVEHVAAILWRQENRDVFASRVPEQPDTGEAAIGIPRAVSALAIAGAEDLEGYNLVPENVAKCGTRIIRLICSAFTGGLPSDQPLHKQLAQAWLLEEEASEVLRAALVLCADHELNVSAFTVRCTASTGATPYAALAAGLCALQGPKHGGRVAQVQAFINEIERAPTLEQGIADRLRRGEKIPGFGHPLYPGQDPRAKCLLELLSASASISQGYEAINRIRHLVQKLTGNAPNIDFALASLARLYALPAHADFALFAIGRSVGWIAHAQEQYENRQLLRPRARYVGEAPVR